MSDPLSPPPWRTIPTDVRTRILDSPLQERRRRPVLVPLAAAVAGLAIAGVFAVQALGGPDQASVPHPAPGLDRCAAALPGAPGLGEWEQAFETPFGDFKVFALRVAGKPVFCEVTPTAVTVSTAEPAYIPGTGTGLVMTTPLGTIAGVVDPSWQDTRIRTGDMIRPPTVVDGLFVAGFKGANPVEVADNGKPWAVMPAPAQAPVTVVDARKGPAPDRTSGRGKLLGDCIEAASKTDSVIDPDSWQPGAIAESGDKRTIVTRNAYGYSTCWQSLTTGTGSFGRLVGGQSYQADNSANQGPSPKVFPGYAEPGGNTVAFGVVPPDTRRVQIAIGDAAPIEADVADSTFAVVIPQSATSSQSSAKLTYRLFDTAGQLTYEGPPQR